MTNINKEGYKPSYQKSYIQLESIADKAEAARIANGTVKEHQPKRVTDDAIERMAKSDKAHLRVTDYDRMRELYEQGMTDGKIAREMGLVDQSLVRKWRDRYGIPAHGNQKRVPKFNQDLALQMYQDGSSDRLIADAMDVDRSMVYQWRKREGLKPMKEEQRTMKTTMTERLKTALGEEKPKVEQLAPVVDAYQITHSMPQDDLEPDMDAMPETENVETVTNQVEKEFMETAVVEIGVDDFCKIIKKASERPVIETASLDDIIDEKNAIIQDLLVKNAELAGFIDGIKFIRGWLAE